MPRMAHIELPPQTIGHLMKTHQLVFVYGSAAGSSGWVKGPLHLVAIVPFGAFAARELWKDCEEHWKKNG